MTWIIVTVLAVCIVCLFGMYLYKCIRGMMDNDFAGLDMVFGAEERMDETESIDEDIET